MPNLFIFDQTPATMIYAIGETIYDIIFRNEEPLAAKAGGAMLNTAVSLGRLGLPVTFISEFANDRTGDIISDFLERNGVDASLCYRYDDGKTTIALAFLNNQNDARYSFYKLLPEHRLEISMPDFRAGDIVLFGAFFSLMPEVRRQLVSFVEKAKMGGALIVYDPNIRSPHKDEIVPLREMIMENLELADIVRGSDEDFMTMFGIRSAIDAWALAREHDCKMLVYTRSGENVHAFFGESDLVIQVPPVPTLSTVGAGDTFNAGLIFMLEKLGIGADGFTRQLDTVKVQKIVSTAISFGSHSCTHYENYITVEFAKSFTDYEL